MANWGTENRDEKRRKEVALSSRCPAADAEEDNCRRRSHDRTDTFVLLLLTVQYVRSKMKDEKADNERREGKSCKKGKLYLLIEGVWPITTRKENGRSKQTQKKIEYKCTNMHSGGGGKCWNGR